MCLIPKVSGLINFIATDFLYKVFKITSMQVSFLGHSVVGYVLSSNIIARLRLELSKF